MFDIDHVVVSPPRGFLPILVDPAQASTVATLTRTLHHEMVHVLLFIETRWQRLPTSQITHEWTHYLDQVRTLPIYNLVMDNITAYTGNQDVARETLDQHLVQEHFTHRAETRAYGRTARAPRNATLATFHVNEELSRIRRQLGAPSLQVIRSRTELLFDEIDRLLP